MPDNSSVTSVVNSSEILRHAFVAFIAGLAHALSNGCKYEGHVHHKHSMWEKLGEFVASTLIASFSGVIFGLFALYYFGNESYLTLAITGSGGFVGARGLKMITDSVVIAMRSVITKRGND